MRCKNCGKMMDDKKTVCSECGWESKEVVKNNFLPQINMEKWALLGAIVCAVIAVVAQGMSWYIMLDRFGYKVIPLPSYVLGGIRLLLCCATVILMFRVGKSSETKRNKILFLCQVISGLVFCVLSCLTMFQQLTSMQYVSSYFDLVINTIYFVCIVLIPIVLQSDKHGKSLFVLVNVLFDIFLLVGFVLKPCCTFSNYDLSMWISHFKHIVREIWRVILEHRAVFAYSMTMSVLGFLPVVTSMKVALYFWTWWFNRRNHDACNKIREDCSTDEM